MDATRAVTVKLPATFKAEGPEAKSWPDGFWPLVNSASSHYDRGRYAKARDLYVQARLLLGDYDRVNTALLRTYRKLYSAAIKSGEWSAALDELTCLFAELPDLITDTDRKAYNKAVEQPARGQPELAARKLDIPSSSAAHRAEAQAHFESSSYAHVSIEADPDWRRPKDEKPQRSERWRLTPSGFHVVTSQYSATPAPHRFSRLATYSEDGALLGTCSLATDTRRQSISPDGKFLLGFTDDLFLRLWSTDGNPLAERLIGREAQGSKYHVRSVAVSAGASLCLCTSSTRAYLLDRELHTVAAWIVPTPPGYVMERAKDSPEDARVREALAALELTGHPSQEEIRSQFRRLAMRYHPDHNPDDPRALERMKQILAAHEIVSDEDVVSALEDLGFERYYKPTDEIPITVPELGISFKISISVSGEGDWIYASHIAPLGDPIYLGCYSGSVYSVSLHGSVRTVFTTDAPIAGILQEGAHLYIWTHTSLFVLRGTALATHIDLRGASLELASSRCLVIKRRNSLLLYSANGAPIGVAHLPSEPFEVIPAAAGLVVQTRARRFTLVFPS